MSNFASFVTEPFLPIGPYEAVAKWFREECYECTEIKREGQMVAFAGVIRDMSWWSCMDQTRGAIGEISDIIGDKDEFLISIIGTLPDEHEILSVQRWRQEMRLATEKHTETIKLQAARAARAERDRHDTEGMVNPDLDAFLGTKL